MKKLIKVGIGALALGALFGIGNKANAMDTNAKYYINYEDQRLVITNDTADPEVFIGYGSPNKAKALKMPKETAIVLDGGEVSIDISHLNLKKANCITIRSVYDTLYEDVKVISIPAAPAKMGAVVSYAYSGEDEALKGTEAVNVKLQQGKPLADLTGEYNIEYRTAYSTWKDVDSDELSAYVEKGGTLYFRRKAAAPVAITTTDGETTYSDNYEITFAATAPADVSSVMNGKVAIAKVQYAGLEADDFPGMEIKTKIAARAKAPAVTANYVTQAVNVVTGNGVEARIVNTNAYTPAKVTEEKNRALGDFKEAHPNLKDSDYLLNHTDDADVVAYRALQAYWGGVETTANQAKAQGFDTINLTQYVNENADEDAKADHPYVLGSDNSWYDIKTFITDSSIAATGSGAKAKMEIPLSKLAIGDASEGTYYLEVRTNAAYDPSVAKNNKPASAIARIALNQVSPLTRVYTPAAVATTAPATEGGADPVETTAPNTVIGYTSDGKESTVKINDELTLRLEMKETPATAKKAASYQYTIYAKNDAKTANAKSSNEDKKAASNATYKVFIGTDLTLAGKVDTKLKGSKAVKPNGKDTAIAKSAKVEANKEGFAAGAHVFVCRVDNKKNVNPDEELKYATEWLDAGEITYPVIEVAPSASPSASPEASTGSGN